VRILYRFCKILIDTLNISYCHKEEPYLKAELLSNLEKVTEVKYHNGECSYQSEYKDYSITLGRSNLNLRGSIAKQYYGNNFQTTTRPQLIETIGELSEHLNFDISECKVNRVDVATNYEMNHSPPVYFDSLGQDKYYKRQPQWNTTVYWNQTKRKKLCYDKGQWAKDKGLLIPLEFRGLNIFRFENRLMSAFVVGEVMGKLKPQVKHLFEEETYKTLIDEWYKQWNNIEKIKKVNFNLKPNMKQSEIKDLMIAGFMEDMGQEGYGTLLQRMKDYRVFNHASLYTRFKNTIKDIRDRNSIDHNLLIEELEMKIGDVEVYYS
tara:strand:- start:74 stop:1036 length:963 start_codon:yes stop_codon:yes gene_type:complete